MAQDILADKRDRVNRVISFISGQYVSVCVYIYIITTKKAIQILQVEITQYRKFSLTPLKPT